MKVGVNNDWTEKRYILQKWHNPVDGSEQSVEESMQQEVVDPFLMSMCHLMEHTRYFYTDDYQPKHPQSRKYTDEEFHKLLLAAMENACNNDAQWKHAYNGYRQMIQRVGVVMITCQGNVIFVKGIHGHRFEFPKGQVDSCDNGSLSAGAGREALEETGVDLTGKIDDNTTSFEYEAKFRNGMICKVRMYFVDGIDDNRLPLGGVETSSEIQAIRTYSLRELKDHIEGRTIIFDLKRELVDPVLKSEQFREFSQKIAEKNDVVVGRRSKASEAMMTANVGLCSAECG